jgi:signal transduction histidine kinase
MMALYYARIVASGAELETEMRGHLATAAALRKATAQAERASAAKAEFVASMSHELRTPLNAVIGYSQMLLDDAADKDDQQTLSDLDRIHTAGQNLLRLVTEVLDLSKIEAGKMELSTSTILVSDLLGQLAKARRPALEARSNTLTIECAPAVGAVVWDATRMGQAIGQVLDNAIKFTEAGQITVSARREPGEEGDDIIIDVRDTGIGIAPDVLPNLFEKFTGAHDATTSKYGDRGLGLTLSLALCEMVNGGLTAESEPGKGSCFTLRLPAKPAIASVEQVGDLAAA